MSSARELLEQADALMRRNRRPPREEDVPELTDAVGTEALPRASRRPLAEATRPAVRPPSTVDDIPELTEAVEEIEAPSIQEYPDDPDELSRWLQENEPEIPARTPPVSLREPGAVDPAAFAPAPAAPARLRDPVAPQDMPAAPDARPVAPDPVAPLAERILAEAPVHTSVHSAATRFTEAIDLTPVGGPVEEILLDTMPAPAPADEIFADEAPATITPTAGGAGLPLDTDDPERWKALAEEIRMQVLQRIDIFTDTGLREQLTARLQPVVDRASADLVATINREVGQLLRAYVAEAIEREIEHWRHGGG